VILRAQIRPVFFSISMSATAATIVPPRWA